METVTRGQIDFIYIAYGQDKSEVRSRWIEINGTDSVTEEGTSGSYYTVKALVAKYADLAGRVALVFNGKILTFNGKILTFPGIGSSELDANYLLLRTFLDEMGLDDESEEFENFDWETYSYLLSQYYDSEKRLTERVYDALQNYEELTRNNLTFFLDGYSGTLTTIQQQIDGKAETWYQGTDPSSSWLTDAEKEKHVGDLWYCTANISGTYFEKNTTWYYKSTTTASVTTYAWVQQDVPDEVFDAIDGKATIYINTVASPPTNYRAKDLWILPANATIGGTAYKKGDMLRATQDSVTYDASHWVLATRYTDDTRIDEWSQASNVTPVEKQELKNIYEEEYGARAEISAKLALYVSDIHSVQEFEDYLDAFDDLEGVIDYYTGSSTWAQVIPESSSYKISETLTAYYDAKRIINNKISALAQSDYGYLKQYLQKDTTIITDGFVLSGFIGVVRTDDTTVPPEDYIIAGINADKNLPGWQDQNHGTLLIAAGIDNGSMSTATTNAKFRVYADGAMHSTMGTIGGWELGIDRIRAIGDNNGAIELNSSEARLIIYNQENNRATQMDGAHYGALSDLINTDNLISTSEQTQVTTSKSITTDQAIHETVSFQSLSDLIYRGNLPVSGTLTFKDVNFTVTLASTAAFPIGSVFVELYEPTLAQVLYSKTVTDLSTIAEHQLLVTTNDITTPELEAGQHVIYLRITVDLPSGHGLNGRSLVISSSIKKRKYAVLGYEQNLTRLFGNGLVISQTGQDFLAAMASDDGFDIRAESGDAGLEVFRSKLRLKVKGVWYTVTRNNSGYLILTT